MMGLLFARHPTSKIEVLNLLRRVLSLSSCSATTHAQGALFLNFCKLGLGFFVHCCRGISKRYFFRSESRRYDGEYGQDLLFSIR